MANVSEAEQVRSALLVERRRPGRPAQVSPELVPLLRGEIAVELEIDFPPEEQDQLGSARGIALGILISAALWVAIAYAGSWIFS
jgi:hypothetical protein